MKRPNLFEGYLILVAAVTALAIVITVAWGVEQRSNAERYCELLGGIYDGAKCLIVESEV